MKRSFLMIAIIVALMAFGFNAQTVFAQGWVAGRVIDADENPVAGAQVALQQVMHERGQRPFRARTETNENGEFGFRAVTAGDYAIHAGTRDLGMDREQIEVVDGAGTRVLLQLEGRRGGGGDEERGAGAVIVTVLTPDREPYEGARVTVVPVNRERGRQNRAFRGITDADGRVILLNVPEGNYVVQAMIRGGGARERLEVIADDRNFVELTLQRIDRRGEGEGNGNGPRGDRRCWNNE